MEQPQVVQVLKRDALGSVELLDGPRGLLIRRVASGGRIPFSGVVARLLCRREDAALRRAQGVAGLPQAVQDEAYTAAAAPGFAAPTPSSILLRTYLSGEPLHRAQSLPRDFFELLEARVKALHAAGVCHNDLHKEQNVVVLEDGRPALIDFQLASCHPRGGRLFESRVRDDLRHVKKHQRRYALRGEKVRESAAAAPAVPRRSLVAGVWRKTGKPLYNFLTRVVLRRRDGEQRRPSSGPWPEWVAPVGPES